MVALGTGSGALTGRGSQIGKLADHFLLTENDNEDLARLLDSFQRIAPELRG